jgi:hypothetical protein
MAVPPKRLVLHHNNAHANQLGTLFSTLNQQSKAAVQFVAYALLAAVNGNAVYVPGPANQPEESTPGPSQSRYQTCDPTIQFKFRHHSVA